MSMLLNPKLNRMQVLYALGALDQDARLAEPLGN